MNHDRKQDKFQDICEDRGIEIKTTYLESNLSSYLIGQHLGIKIATQPLLP